MSSIENANTTTLNSENQNKRSDNQVLNGRENENRTNVRSTNTARKIGRKTHNRADNKNDVRKRVARVSEHRTTTQARGARIGRALLLVACAVLLILPVLLIAHPVAYIPLIAVILLVVISFAYVRAIRHAVTIRVDNMTPTCTRGEDVPLTVDIVNTSRVPIVRMSADFFVSDLFGGNLHVQNVSCSIPAHGRQTLTYMAHFSHLGEFSAGVENVVLHDLLGLFRAQLNTQALREVVVSPREVVMREPDSMKVVPADTTRAMRTVEADDVDYASVREYYFGDPMKTVHWNLSARDPQGTLYTRLFEAHTNPTLTVIVDPFVGGGATEFFGTATAKQARNATSAKEAESAKGASATQNNRNAKSAREEARGFVKNIREGKGTHSSAKSGCEAKKIAEKYTPDTCMSLFDGIVEATTSLCEQARLAGIDTEIRYITKNGVPASTRIATRDDAVALVGDMMSVTPVGDASVDATRVGDDGVETRTNVSPSVITEMLSRAGFRSHGSGNVALMSARTSADILSTLAEISIMQRRAMMFFACLRNLNERELENVCAPLHALSSAGVSWWRVESNEVQTEVVGL